MDVIGPVSRQMTLNRSYAGKKFPENEMVMPDKYLHYDQKKELRRTGLGRGPKGSNKVLN